MTFHRIFGLPMINTAFRKSVLSAERESKTLVLSSPRFSEEIDFTTMLVPNRSPSDWALVRRKLLTAW
jgi:hypothetical protein